MSTRNNDRTPPAANEDAHRAPVVLFDHHPQQLRDPIRGHIDALPGLRAEVVIPHRGIGVKPVGFEFRESLVYEARCAPTAAGATFRSQGHSACDLLRVLRQT